MNSLKSISKALCLCLLVSFVACKSDKAPNEAFYTFEHHIKNDGVKPVEGDLVSFRILAYVGDSLVQSSEEGSVNRLKIPVNSSAFLKQNPLYYAFLQMSEKDSATMVVLVDSLENIPAYAKSGDKLTYNIVISGIQSGGLRDLTKEQMDSIAVKRTYGESAINAANRLNQTIENWSQQEATGTREVKTTTSGIEYLIIFGGSKGLAKANEWVSYNYVVKEAEGLVLLNTFQNAKPVNTLMGANSNIPAIDELLTLAPIGSTVVAKVPAKLGYKKNDGDTSTPADQTLLLEIIRTDPYDKAIQQ